MRPFIKLFAALAVVGSLLQVDGAKELAAKKVKCKDLVHVCEDGVTKVYPNPFNQCEFDLCPEDVEDGDGEDEENDDDDEDDEGDDEDDEEEIKECEKVVHTCADGVTKVFPNPLNDCEFDACPEEPQMDPEDVSIEDIMDVVVTPSPAPTKDDFDHDEDGWDRDLPTKKVTTAPPVAVQWTAVDAAKAPTLVQEAVQQAFALYNSTQICDKLILFYDSIEAHNKTSKKHHKKEKKLQSFHLVVNVECYLHGAKQVGGKFILNLEEHGKNEARVYQLIQCAHLEAWGELSNWLASRNNVGYCETPAQKHKFDVQPKQYVNYHAKELTLFDTVVRNKSYVAIVAIIVGALAALVLLTAFLVIQRRYCGYQKLKVDGSGASPDTVADDEIDMDVRLTPPSKRKLAEGTEKNDQEKYV